ncbi:MAG: hypothetical protein EFKGCFLK_02642 [Rhodocyclaceae bacterium]|nr:MAG: hypothetical protein F9K21_01750 [Rhodocyclaceae bacterium]MBV6409020.1 hypothetical protein [Rhodocyclaceae bacterium]CAG0927655.1 hypothetical protein RHDC3_00505 [Rhodocyclaceae bacterium]
MFLRAAVFLGLTFLAALPGSAAQITLSLDSIRHEAFEAEGVSVAFDAARRGEADIRLGRLLVAGAEYRELKLHCSGFYFDGRRLDCPQGALQRLDERGRNRPALPFSLVWRADGFLDFSLRDVDAVALSPLVKRLRGWKPQGRIDLALRIEGGRAKLDLAAQDLAFASREGDIAGKEIAFTLNAAAERSVAGWHWRARLDWPQGELYRAPWRRLAGVRLEAEGDLTQAELEVDLARLDVAGLGGVSAGLRWNRARGEATDGGFVTDRIDLAAAMRDWLQPWLTTLGLPEWQATGHGRISAEWQARELRRFYAGLEEATLADSTGHLELDGVNARIPWEAGVPNEAEVGIGRGRLGDLPLGGFTLPLKLDGNEAKVEKLTAPLLDGRLLIDELRLAKSQSGWHGEFEGGIEGVSMPKLSRALRLPAMAGSLTARIPRIAYEKGVLYLDGALAIEVFDGGIIAHQLRLIDPFGKDRRFVADVTARNLDLGMLTRTFAFGAIEGRFDADLHDLEMQGWKPLKFEVRIASSEGDYPRSLSIGALKDITALGEAGTPDRLARAPERAGFSFGYSRIGFGCTLRNGVCLMDGVEREGDGVVLMRGTGMPSVSIIGYNRHIDWEALVARIREVIAGRPGVVIE